MLSAELKTQIRNSFNAAKDAMPGFKIRQAQNKMIAEISKTLAGEHPKSNPILCVEAPTGTGKTLAYLLSAIPIAIANEKKLVISSANVALQEQLLFKDIPEVQKYCTVDFEYALVKGRSRYLCVRNLINLVEDNASQEPLFDNPSLWDSPPEKHQLSQMSEMLDLYSNKKWNGEIDALDKTPPPNLWQKIACNRFTCNAKSCTFYSDCAFFKARQKITNADVIVANHDLILADLNAGNTILPAAEDSIYIFDEAHHLSQKALSHFSLNTNSEFIKTSIKQAQSAGEKVHKLTQQTPPKNLVSPIDNYLNDLIEMLEQLEFEDEIHLFQQGIISADIAKICQNLLIAISTLSKQFDKSKESWEDYLKISPLDKTIAEPLNNILGQCAGNLSSILALFSSFLAVDKAGSAPHSRWIGRIILSNKKTNYSINSAQIDIANNLHNLIWSKAAGSVLTSATLSSLGSFHRLNQQLGLVKNDNQYLRLPSPFLFDKVDFIVANFKANPTQISEHTNEVAAQLLKRIDPKTGSLVLFASNKQMQMVADLVEKKFACDLLIQGEFAKKLILEKHINCRKNGKGSIIFGLDSFAEGVDLKGENLTHVVIVKLRFSVPTSPIEKTTSDYLESQGRNSFMEISLPDASLKLIQACGRLIRTETDTGKITIFDKRLTTKRYGKQLLDALPDYNIVIE
ncbi:MAG: ATP-dependent DNA helicase DinG [Candidatus Thioglobus sp.]|nr:ATP-dependent DNA helicase DinG [Candidatus Thioglobus sp.]